MPVKTRIAVFVSLFVLIILPLTVWSVKNLNFETRKRAEEPKLPIKVISAQSFSQYQEPIILLDLLIDKPNRNIEIVSVKRGISVIPDYKNQAASDFIEIEIDKKDKNLASFIIPLSAEEASDTIGKNGAISGGDYKKLDKFHYSITLPFEEESTVSITKRFVSGAMTAASDVSTNLMLPTFDKPKAKVTNKGVTQEMPMEQISISGVRAQAADFQIEEVFDGNPSLTDPQRTLDIIFVASGFFETTYNLFRNYSYLQSDLLIGFSSYPGKSPFPENKHIIKVRRLVSSANYGETPETIDFNLIKTDLTALGIPYDQIIVVTTAPGQYNYGRFGVGCILLYNEFASPIFAHELGHSFGGLSDEYIRGNQSKILVRHDGNCKEDPEEPWVNNSPGGSYLWCQFGRNLYKPEENSLMGNLNYNFNAPSKYVLQEALSVYTVEAISFVVWSDRLYFYRDIDSPSQTDLVYTPSIQNYCNHQIHFTARINPEVNWLRIEGTAGTIDPFPSSVSSLRLIIDFKKISARGKYQTTLLVTATDSYAHEKTKEIPISLLAGSRNDNPSLSITDPKNGDVYSMENNIPISISQEIEQPGWRGIEYFYSIPDHEDTNFPLIFSSRTIAPFSASWNTQASDPMLGSRRFAPGTYLLWAEGYPYFGQGGYPYFSTQPIKTNVVEVEFPAPDGTTCTGLYYWFVCANEKYSRRCFRNASDCMQQGFTYCCPPHYELTPTPTPSNIPTPEIICLNRNFGNLDCDEAGQINQSDLQILLNNWRGAPTPIP